MVCVGGEIRCASLRQSDNSYALSLIDGFFGTGCNLGGNVKSNNPETQAVGLISLMSDQRRTRARAAPVYEQTKGDSKINFAADQRIQSQDKDSKATCLLIDWNVGYGCGVVGCGFLLTNLMVKLDFRTMERLPTKLVFYLVEPLTKISDMMTLIIGPT
jgi:hypothetical protein